MPLFPTDTGYWGPSVRPEVCHSLAFPMSGRKWHYSRTCWTFFSLSLGLCWTLADFFLREASWTLTLLSFVFQRASRSLALSWQQCVRTDSRRVKTMRWKRAKLASDTLFTGGKSLHTSWKERPKERLSSSGRRTSVPGSKGHRKKRLNNHSITYLVLEENIFWRFSRPFRTASPVSYRQPPAPFAILCFLPTIPRCTYPPNGANATRHERHNLRNNFLRPDSQLLCPSRSEDALLRLAVART